MPTLAEIHKGSKTYFQEYEYRKGRQVYVRSWPSREAYEESQIRSLARAAKEYPHLHIRLKTAGRKLAIGSFDIKDAGDFVVRCNELEPNSIDAIITDPPYSKEYLPLYEKLASVASRVLKPGGSLIVMVGQSYIPEIIKMFSNYLTYQWLVAYYTPGGQSAQLWQRKVNTFWKPILWYVKGTYQGKWIGDVAKSAVNANEKDLHQWQQSESGMLDLVDRFTSRKAIILDPFLGSGTTGYATVKLGRQFVGIDISDEAVTTARKRLAELLSNG